MSYLREELYTMNIVDSQVYLGQGHHLRMDVNTLLKHLDRAGITRAIACPVDLMFGSDGGIGLPAVTTAYIRRINELNAPREHKDMILGGNAEKFILGQA